jgi:hypothetical protein
VLQANAYLALSMLHMLLRIAGYAVRHALRVGDLASARHKIARSAECLRLLLRLARDDPRPRRGGAPS